METGGVGACASADGATPSAINSSTRFILFSLSRYAGACRQKAVSGFLPENCDNATKR
jgi:hypothetical protein